MLQTLRISNQTPDENIQLQNLTTQQARSSESQHAGETRCIRRACRVRKNLVTICNNEPLVSYMKLIQVSKVQVLHVEFMTTHLVCYDSDVPGTDSVHFLVVCRSI